MASFGYECPTSLMCAICLDVLNDPKQLPCSHTFCKKCLEKVIEHSRNTRNNIACPLCRALIFVPNGDVTNLKTNVTLKSQINDVRNAQELCEVCDTNPEAVHFCCDYGKYMCNTCLEHQSTWEPNLKHKVVSEEECRVILNEKSHNQIDQERKKLHERIAGKHNQTDQEIKKLLEITAARRDQLEAHKVELCKRLDEMKVDERLITSTESASVASYSLKAPLEGEMVVIHDSLSGELKDILDRNDPKKKLATDVADRAEQLIFTPNNQGDQLNIGEVRFGKCDLECDVELSKKDKMTDTAATPDGRMAVGCNVGGIDIVSPDGQLQQTVLRHVSIRNLGSSNQGRYVVRDESNVIKLYTKVFQKLDVTSESLSHDEGGYDGLTVDLDSDDQIYISYRKATKIKVLSPAGLKAIWEITSDGYESEQIASYDDIIHSKKIKITDKEGVVNFKVEKSGINPCAAATRSFPILIAWVGQYR